MQRQVHSLDLLLLASSASLVDRNRVVKVLFVDMSMYSPGCGSRKWSGCGSRKWSRNCEIFIYHGIIGCNFDIFTINELAYFNMND